MLILLEKYLGKSYNYTHDHIRKIKNHTSFTNYYFCSNVINLKVYLFTKMQLSDLEKAKDSQLSLNFSEMANCCWV